MFFLAAAESTVNPTYSLIVMSVGIAIVLGLIIFAKANAFMALITAAMVVSLCAPGKWGQKLLASRKLSVRGAAVSEL